MVDSKKDLIISNWQEGMAPSYAVGSATHASLDINSAPGILRAGFKSVKQSGSTVTGLVNWFTADQGTGNIYAIDANQVVYVSTDTGVTWSVVVHASASAGAGNGACVWKNYLFISASNAIDVYGPLNGVAAWTNGWQTIGGDGGLHPMLWGQDDILYVGSTQFVASVMETSGSTFAPGTGASYTFTQKALTLPANVFIRSMEELGVNLLIGVYNVGKGPIQNNIYPWDRTSTTFRLPIKVSGDGTHAMKTIGQQTYILAGKTGDIYVTNGTQATPLKTLKHSNNNTTTPQPGAIMDLGGRPHFGFGPGFDVDIYTRGVYSLTPSLQYALNNEAGISNGALASTVTIGALYPIDSYKYLIGWSDSNAATFGIDLVAGSGFRTTGTYDSQFYIVGDYINKRKFRSIMFQLAKPLISGQSIVLSYKYNISAGFTSIGTYDFATYGAITSKEIPFPGLETDSIQIRIQVVAATSSVATPDLQLVILR